MSAATDIFARANESIQSIFAPDPLTISGVNYPGVPDEARREEKIEDTGFLARIDLAYTIFRNHLATAPVIGVEVVYQQRSYRLAALRSDEVSHTLLLREIT